MKGWSFLLALPFGFVGSYLALRRRTWPGGLATYLGFIVLAVVVALAVEAAL